MASLQPQTTDSVRKTEVPMMPSTRVRYCTCTKAHSTRTVAPNRASRYSALVYMPMRYIGRKTKKPASTQPPSTPTQFAAITLSPIV